MLPNCKIIISKEGNSHIIGEEESIHCSKLIELGRSAGKVIKEKDKEHPPVYQDIHLKRK